MSSSSPTRVTEHNIDANFMKTVRKETRRMRTRMNKRVADARESKFQPPPQELLEMSELATLLDQVMAIVSWHHHGLRSDGNTFAADLDAHLDMT